MAELDNLRKFVAPEIIFGDGARKLVSRYARNLGVSKVFLVSDPGVENAGWCEEVEDNLTDNDIEYVLYTDVSPNPRAEEVMKATDIYNNNRCDGIVCVGGGSPMDLAKGVGIVATNKKHVCEFEGVDLVQLPVPPLIFIPTTSGTSSDVSQFAIISDQAEKIKIAIVSKKIVPDVALVDPTPTTTMDPYLTACTGLDALVHAIEAFVSNASSPMTDIHALKAIELVRANLITAIKEPHNIKAREDMMLASLEAGLAFSNAILGAVHAMAHSLGGLLDLPHGECNAILLDHVIAYNFDASPEKFGHIAKLFGVDTKNMNETQVKLALIKTVQEFKTTAGVTKKLAEAGVNNSDIPSLATKALNDSCIITNPKKANKRDIEVIYEEAS